MKRNLSKECHVLILHNFNAIIRLQYYPKEWKKSIIIMLPKPGKNLSKFNSYWLISLLPNLSKLFEKCLLVSINKFIKIKGFILEHHFRFAGSTPIMIGDKIIPKATKIKYVGVHLDKTLTCKNQIEHKYRQVKLKIN